MPTKKRHKTNYTGVHFIESDTKIKGKPERIFYITYRKDGKLIEEKAGRQFRDDMTASRASQIRTKRINGEEATNREKRKAVKDNLEKEASKWTMERLWAEYQQQQTQSKSLDTDQYRFNKYIKEKFGHLSPDEIEQMELDRFRTSLLNRLAPQTVKHILGLMKRIINFGHKKGICDPTSFTIDMPRVNNKKTEDLTDKQLRDLLSAIAEEPNIQAANIMKMALFTGMRRGEMFGLKWEHIDFERGFIRIVDPKGGTDQTIPLNENARNLLNSHPRTKSEYVFPGKDGKKRVTIRKAVNKIKKKANLPKDFRPLHGLRHVYASMLASSGKVDMYTLQKLLTHKNPQMTQRYAHLRDEALKKAADVADGIFDGYAQNQEDAKKIN